jgi:AraC-like DNA-binding protein
MLAILPTHVICIEHSSEDAVIEAVLYSDDYWVSLAHSVDYKLLKIVEHSPYLRLDEENRVEVFYLLDLIKKHEADDETNTDIERYLAGGLAFALLMLLVSLLGKNNTYAPRPVTRKEMLTHDFFELLSQYYETQRQVAFYASKLCVTPKHLSTMVKEVTHLSIQEWINNVTVLNIKRRLLTTTDTIQQISEDLNFQTPSTFIRYFRQHTGTTPSRYRTDNQIRRR